MVSRRVAFWALFAVTNIVYLVMVVWSLPKVSEAAGGLVPFDMRPTGYSFEEAKAFLAALGPEGTAFYLHVQQRLDLLYPALLAATLFFAIRALTPSWSPIPASVSVDSGTSRRWRIRSIVRPISLFGVEAPAVTPIDSSPLGSQPPVTTGFGSPTGLCRSHLGVSRSSARST